MAITYARASIIEVLRSLEEVVVSLDQMGSAAPDMSEEEFNAAAAAFLINQDVFRKMARARSILSEPFSTEVDRENLDQAMRTVAPWRRSP